MNLRALVAALSLGASGCATVGTLQTAEPIEEHSVQVALEPGLGATGKRVYPQAGLAVRYGFGRRWDAGVRFGSGGIGLTGKFALTDRSSRGLRVAIAPAIGGLRVGRAGLRGGSIYAQLPVLIGVPFGEGHELTVGPKLHDWMFFTEAPGVGMRTNVVGVGSSLGVSLRLARGVRILPEVSMIRPIAGGSRTHLFFIEVGKGRRIPLYQASLALLIGGGR